MFERLVAVTKISLKCLSDFAAVRGFDWPEMTALISEVLDLNSIYIGLENLMKNTVIASVLIASLASCSGAPMETNSPDGQRSTTETVGLVAAGAAAAILVLYLFAVNSPYNNS